MTEKMRLSDYSRNAIRAERRAQCDKEEYKPLKHVISTVEVLAPEDPRHWLELIECGEMEDRVISSFGDAPDGYVWIITK